MHPHKRFEFGFAGAQEISKPGSDDQNQKASDNEIKILPSTDIDLPKKSLNPDNSEDLSNLDKVFKKDTDEEEGQILKMSQDVPVQETKELVSQTGNLVPIQPSNTGLSSEEKQSAKISEQDILPASTIQIMTENPNETLYLDPAYEEDPKDSKDQKKEILKLDTDTQDLEHSNEKESGIEKLTENSEKGMTEKSSSEVKIKEDQGILDLREIASDGKPKRKRLGWGQGLARLQSKEPRLSGKSLLLLYNILLFLFYSKYSLHIMIKTKF